MLTHSNNKFERQCLQQKCLLNPCYHHKNRFYGKSALSQILYYIIHYQLHILLKTYVTGFDGESSGSFGFPAHIAGWIYSDVILLSSVACAVSGMWRFNAAINLSGRLLGHRRVNFGTKLFTVLVVVNGGRKILWLKL